MFGRKKRADSTENVERNKVYAVIPGAGSSRRMGGGNKLLLPIAGEPVLRRTLEAFALCEAIDGIVLSCRADQMDEYESLCSRWQVGKQIILTTGGVTRAESVYRGVLACPPDTAYVAIHDAARPFIRPELIAQTVETAKRDSAAALAVEVKDSIKRVKNGRMVENVERDSIVAVQTPQCFDIDLIRAALHRVVTENISVTDDCGAAELLGQPTTIVAGDYNNIKITTQEDIVLGEQIWKEQHG